MGTNFLFNNTFFSFKSSRNFNILAFLYNKKMTVYPNGYFFRGKKPHSFFEGLNMNSSFFSTLSLLMLLVRLMCFKAVGWYLSCQKGRLKTHLSFWGFVLHCKMQRKRKQTFPAYCWYVSETGCMCHSGCVLGLGRNFSFCQPWMFTLEQIQDPEMVFIL